MDHKTIQAKESVTQSSATSSRQTSSSKRSRSALTEIREQIGAGQIRTAQRLAEEAARSHPRDPEILNIHRILNEGRSYSRPATGRNLREEYDWLRSPPEELRGKWVALIGHEVVGSAVTLEELLAGLPAGLEKTPLTARVAS